MMTSDLLPDDTPRGTPQCTPQNAPDDIRELTFLALGEGAARVWSHLPQRFQQHLFEEAVASQGEAVRQQLAVFLHHRHARTSDSIKIRAIAEPDSLGG